MNIKKVFISFFGILISILFFSNVAFASELDSEDELVDLPGYEATFDLNATEAQEQTFIDENGNVGTLGIEPIITDEESEVTPHAIQVPAGRARDYRIYWSTGLVNMEFYITVQRPNQSSNVTNILNANRLSVNVLGGTEDNRNFTWNSKLAEYTGSANVVGDFASIGLRLTAQIQGSLINTSAEPSL